MTTADQAQAAAAPADGLLDRVRLIEDQPLESRADAYAALHDELRRVLEGGDLPPS